MCDNILKDAQKIKKRLLFMGQKDIDENTICELLRSFGPGYEVDFITDMIVGSNDSNHSYEFQNNPTQPGPSNVTASKCGNAETVVINDEVETVDVNENTTDTDDDDENNDDYYETVSWEDNLLMETTPQPSPPLLPTIELDCNNSTPIHSTGAICGSVDIEIFEENNNDPNNNLDVIQILQEQNNYAADTELHNQVQEVGSTENLDSPKPGCSKDLLDTESLISNTTIQDEVIQISNLLPRFKYDTIYKILFKNRHAKNRVELSLWDLLPHKRPVAQFPSKRKLMDDSCIVECKKSLSKAVGNESQNVNNLLIFSETGKQGTTVKNVDTGQVCSPPTVLKGNICSQNTASKTNTTITNHDPNIHDVSTSCSSPNVKRSGSQKNPQVGRVTVAEHFKSILHGMKNKANNTSSQSGILRPPKLIVQNNRPVCMNRTPTSSNNILAPPKLTYLSAQQHKNEMDVDMLPISDEHKEKSDNDANTSTPLNSRHNRFVTPFVRDTTDSSINRSNTSNQLIDNYMQYLQIMEETKRRNASGNSRCGMTRDDIKRLLYSRKHNSTRKHNVTFPQTRVDAPNDAQSIKQDKTFAHTSKIHNTSNSVNRSSANILTYKSKQQLGFNKDTSEERGSAVLNATSVDNRNFESNTISHLPVISNESVIDDNNVPTCSGVSNNSKTNDLGNIAGSSSNVSDPNVISGSGTKINSIDSNSATNSNNSIYASVAVSSCSETFLQNAESSASNRSVDEPLLHIASARLKNTNSNELLAQAASTSSENMDSNELLDEAASVSPANMNSNESIPEAALTGSGIMGSSESLSQAASTSSGSMGSNELLPQAASTSSGGMNNIEPLSDNASSIDIKANSDDLSSQAAGDNAQSVLMDSLPAASNFSIDRNEGVPIITKEKEEELHSEIFQIYNKLITMFPHVDDRYIKEICQSHFKVNAFVNETERLNDLIEDLLMNGDSHPIRIDLEQASTKEIFDVNEQYANLLEILPDADPIYLREKVEAIYSDPDAMVEFVQSKLENPDYPTREQRLMERKRKEQQKQYITEFNVQQFLEIFPDPFAHFQDPNRKCKFDEGAIEILEHLFKQIQSDTIQEQYHRNNFNLAMTACDLEKKALDMSVPRALPRISTKDIPLLQEFAFIKHKKEIINYMEEQSAKEKEEFNESKRRNELMECQCCFDNECLPTKCSTCDEGHVFCNSCIKKGTESRLAEGETRVQCFVNCKGEFSLSVLQRVLQPTKFSILLRKRQEAEVKAAGLEGLVFCPFCHFASIPPPEDKVFKCLNPECMKETCRECKELNHIPFKCNKIKSDKARLFLEERMTEALVRTCYQCGKPYFKEDGCNRIHCSCGAVMCYLCDSPVVGYSHFNAQGSTRTDRCPLWSDNHLINAKAVLKVAEETMKDIKEKDPNIELNAQCLLPQLPAKIRGPHEDVPNSNTIPERVNRIVKYST